MISFAPVRWVMKTLHLLVHLLLLFRFTIVSFQSKRSNTASLTVNWWQPVMKRLSHTVEWTSQWLRAGGRALQPMRQVSWRTQRILQTSFSFINHESNVTGEEAEDRGGCSPDGTISQHRWIHTTLLRHIRSSSEVVWPSRLLHSKGHDRGRAERVHIAFSASPTWWVSAKKHCSGHSLPPVTKLNTSLTVTSDQAPGDGSGPWGGVASPSIQCCSACSAVGMWPLQRTIVLLAETSP